MAKRARHTRVTKKTKPTKPILYSLGAFLVLVGTAAGLSLYHGVSAANPKPIAVAINPNVGIEAKVRDFFTANEAEEMIPVIKCESRFRHFEKDGSVLMNKAGSSATGVAQILTSAHPDPKAIELHNKRFNTELSPSDFNILTLDGNLAYALLLYRIRGTQDWECAKKFRFR